MQFGDRAQVLNANVTVQKVKLKIGQQQQQQGRYAKANLTPAFTQRPRLVGTSILTSKMCSQLSAELLLQSQHLCSLVPCYNLIINLIVPGCFLDNFKVTNMQEPEQELMDLNIRLHSHIGSCIIFCVFVCLFGELNESSLRWAVPHRAAGSTNHLWENSIFYHQELERTLSWTEHVHFCCSANSNRK